MIIPDAAVGSILAAAIAGLVVFISTVLTKEQKTSEFRQVWIDELRKDISQFIAGVSEVVALYVSKKGDSVSQAKFIDDNFKLIHELQMVEHRIVLRLNPVKHAKLIEKITFFRSSMLAAYKAPDRKKIEDGLTSELMSETKNVLSVEWDRVKKGEPMFRRVKYSALFILAIFAVFFIFLLLNPKPTEKVAESVDHPVSNHVVQYFVSPPPVKGAKRVINKIENNAIIVHPQNNDICKGSSCQHGE